MQPKEDIFRLKQFQISQHKEVHRVGTDGVLLGAWVGIENTRAVLDVGTGTGLIALMFAQRLGKESTIVALEPDALSFETAMKNVRQSPFKDQVDIIHKSLQDFTSQNLFDLVVCNPPFFENSLKPLSKSRTRERHSNSLPFSDLIRASKKLLSSQGRLCIIIPVTEGNQFIKLARALGFQVSRQCAVFSKEGKPQERWLLEFDRDTSKEPTQSSLTIMGSKGNWIDEYQLLTNLFYLNF